MSTVESTKPQLITPSGQYYYLEQSVCKHDDKKHQETYENIVKVIKKEQQHKDSPPIEMHQTTNIPCSIQVPDEEIAEDEDWVVVTRNAG